MRFHFSPQECNLDPLLRLHSGEIEKVRYREFLGKRCAIVTTSPSPIALSIANLLTQLRPQLESDTMISNLGMASNTRHDIPLRLSTHVTTLKNLPPP